MPELDPIVCKQWASEEFIPLLEAGDGMVQPGKPAAVARRRPRRKQVAFIVCAVLACMLVLAAGAVALALNIGRGNMTQGASEVEVASGATSYDKGKTVFFEGREYRLNEDMASVLIIGVDKGAEGELNGRADAVMVAAIDNSSGKTSLISIPRDSMVEYSRTVDGQYSDTVTEQLSLAYRYASSDEQSCELMCEAVSRILYNIPIDYYYALKMEGIATLADSVGGVEVDALENVPRAGISAGRHYLLTGQKAYDYLQYRDTSRDNTALGRQERQKQFLKAFAQKALDEAKGDIGVLIGIYDGLAKYSFTNVGVPEFTYLASHFMAYGVDSFSVDSLQGEMTIGEDGYQEFHLDKDAVYRTVLEVYYTPVEDPEAEAAAAAAERDIDSVSDVRF